jgi:hypothetical protein
MAKEKCVKCNISIGDIKYKAEWYCMICYMSQKTKDKEHVREKQQNENTKD